MDSEAIKAAWRTNFAEGLELAAALCIWERGRETLHLCEGAVSCEPQASQWQPDTLVPVWSTTKGPAAATLLWAVAANNMQLETPVRHVWPELHAAY